MMNEPISDQILHQLLKDTADQEKELKSIRTEINELKLIVFNLEESIELSRSDGK